MNKRDVVYKHQERGFTLIEILLVIGLIAFLAAIVIIAINPARQFAQARNTQRRSDVNTVINAVYQFAVENNGLVPGEIAGPATEICQTGIASTTCNTATLINLSNLTVAERYLTALPRDPSCPDACSVSGIGYTVATSTNGRVTVSAPDAELGVTISVTR